MKNGKWAGIVVSFVVVVFLGLYFCLGIFVIQPIGALPEGATVVYWRIGMNLPFVSSIDGIMLDRMGSVSLLGRAMGIATIGQPILERKILNLPFSKSLYLMSTNGVELDR